MKKRSNWFWLAVIGGVLLVCVALIVLRPFDTGIDLPTVTPDPAESGEPTEVVGPVAVVVMGEYVIDAVDLGTVKESFTRTYEGEDGAENTVEFAPGQARMEHSTCPDQVCVGMGWQDGSFPLPIACLPNSVMVQVIEVEEPEESPAVTQGLDGATG